MFLIPGSPSADADVVAFVPGSRREGRPVGVVIEHARADLDHHGLGSLLAGALHEPEVVVDMGGVVTVTRFLVLFFDAGEIADDDDSGVFSRRNGIVLSWGPVLSLFLGRLERRRVR